MFDDDMCRFWAQVDRSLLPLVDQDWAYGHDMRMFGYSVQDYLTSLGISLTSSSILP